MLISDYFCDYWQFVKAIGDKKLLGKTAKGGDQPSWIVDDALENDTAKSSKFTPKKDSKAVSENYLTAAKLILGGKKVLSVAQFLDF